MSSRPVTVLSRFDAAHVLGMSSAVVVLAFAWAKLLHLPWRSVTLAALVVAVVVVVRGILRTRDADAGRGGRATWWWSVVLIAGIFALRMVPMVGAIAPPGGDMSMHLWLARIAVEHTVLPAEQVPLYPGVPYGAYPLGFHAVVASLASNAGGLGPASLVAIAFTHTLFAAGLFVVLRASASAAVAASTAALVVCILRNPQAYVGWGGNPCVLGFAFALFAWESTRTLLERPSTGRVVLAAGWIAATVCTHPTAALVLAIVLMVEGVRALLVRWSRATALALTACALVAIALSLPMLVEWSRAVPSDAERAWVATHHLHPPQSPQFGAGLLPDYWVFVFGDAALAWAVVGAAFCVARGRRAQASVAIALLVVVPFAVVAHRHAGLPLSLALYPERAMLVLVVPFGLLLLPLVEWVLATVRARPRRTSVFPWSASLAVALALSVTASANASKYAIGPAHRSVHVTETDARAFTAMREQAIASGSTPVVTQPGGAAAAFLPGLWGIASPDIQWNPVWRDEFERWRERHPANLVYDAAGP